MPTTLDPPFSKDYTTTVPLVHPAVIPLRDGHSLLRPGDDIESYVRLEVTTRRLDKMWKHLHYAGLPRHARPLHRQILMGRRIIITEDVDEHLVWYRGRIFIKPLARWLLDKDFWEENLCADENINKAACGFLLSYIWLISRESDFVIGKELHLLPEDLNWEHWVNFQNGFLEKIDAESLVQVSKRYQYGELRLTRLSQIYRFAPSVTSLRNCVVGYFVPSTWYQEFFKLHFGWLLAVFVYFTVALAGMQLGLAQEDLQQSRAFQKASYGLVLFSLVFVIASILAIFLTWFTLTVFHFVSAQVYHRKVMRAREGKISSTGTEVHVGKHDV